MPTIFKALRVIPGALPYARFNEAIERALNQRTLEENNYV